MRTSLARAVAAALLPLTLAMATPDASAQANAAGASPGATPALGSAGGSGYAALGTTGLVLGYNQSYTPLWGSRLEVAGLPSLSRQLTEGGIDYRGQVSMRRLGAALDWHPFGNGFRLSAGLSWVDAAIDLQAQALPGATLELGNASVPLGQGDGYSARVALPRTMPYVGLGWGRGFTRGWSMHADLGALIGKARVTGVLTASLRSKIQLAGFDPDAELDRELQQVRDGVDKLAVYPVLQLGLNYRW